MAPSKNYQVKQIVAYIQGKIERLQEKLKEYESPIFQDLVKNSPHLQYDFVVTKTKLEDYQDMLLAIEKFTDTPKEPEDAKVRKNNKGRND